MRKYILILFTSLIAFPVLSQELRCNVQLVTNQIQGTNKQVFETLQKAIYEFMNNRSWSNLVYETNERIECNMLINLQEQVGSDAFRGTMQIQIRRPVYNTSYSTVLLNLVDNDVEFRYVEFEPLEYSETSHLSNLSSLLSYYAYIIIGLDYDSFSLEGGNPYFQIAEKITSNAQNAKEKGWKPAESTARKNRYWFIHNIMDEEYSPIREFVYKYHRNGLDKMYEKTNESRANIAEDLLLLQNVYRNKPDPFMYYLQVILDAKNEELVNIFSESVDEEKNRVYKILTEIDPTHSDNYKRIIQ